jgi:transposase-like protein
VKLKEMKLADAAALVVAGIAETLFYYAFPREHWRCLRKNNPLERMLRDVRLKNQSGRISGREVGICTAILLLVTTSNS